jgi:predicted dienelactone hydrolase
MSQALDAVVADPRFHPHADRMRLGMLGFSLGGAVALESAGAVPNMTHFTTYCSTPPHDVMSCDHAPGAGGTGTAPRQNVTAERPPSPLRLKALALLDPFAAPFQRQDLLAVTMPVLLFRPDRSELPGEANAIGLKAALPHPPQFETVPGGHFIFVDVCPPFLQAASPEVCQDPPGIDRAVIHRGIEAKIATFFHDHL